VIRAARPGVVRLLALACAVLCGLGGVRTVNAEDRHAEDRAERTARAYFKQAERAFNLGKFKEAERGYAAAFEAQPLPAFVFNLAQCHRNLGNPERALFFYRRYLSLDPNSPNRVLVLDLIAEQERRLAERAAVAERTAAAERAAAQESRVESRPESSKAAVEPPPPELATADAAGQESGETKTAIPDLRPRVPAGETPVTTAAAPPVAPPSPLYRRWWVWAAGGALVAGVAAALLIEREGPRPTGQLGGVDLR
jgi:hypothetical protein